MSREGWVTVAEAAGQLGVSTGRIRQLLGQGRVRGARRSGRDWLIPTPVDIQPGTRGPIGAASMSTEGDLIGRIVAEDPIIASVMEQFNLAQGAYQGALKAMGLIADVESGVGNSADFLFTSPEQDPYVIELHEDS